MTNQQNFARTVARMRQAQKKARQLKAKSYMDLAENLEREVDKALEEMAGEGTKIKQMKQLAMDDQQPGVNETGGGNV